MAVEEAALRGADRRALARAFPELADAPAQQLGEGEECRVWLVADRWVFRFAKTPAIVPAMRREAALMPLLDADLDVAVPVPTVHDSGGGLAFQRYPVVPGEELSRARFEKLDSVARMRCAEQLSTFIAQMRAQDLDRARALGLPEFDYEHYARDVFGRAQSTLLNRLESSERSYVVETMERWIKQGPPVPRPPTVLHADLSPEHILYSPAHGRITGVVDFGDAMIGHPDWELVYLYEDYGPAFMDMFWRHYPEAEREPSLVNVVAFFELMAIEWATSGIEEGADYANDALRQLGRLASRVKTVE